MIGAMKRKASLSLSETCTMGSQGGNCGEGGCGGGGGAGNPKPEKRIRWDGPRTQSLIEHYRVHEYLWNPKLADYKNDKKRTQCLEGWLEQNHLEKDLVNEVKMKLHGLRTSFGHQLKLEGSNATDMDKDESNVFQSKWQWYNQLSFLKETMVFRSSSTNNNHSPSDSPPLDHQHGHMGHVNMGHHDEDVKMEMNAPLNMQVMAHSHYAQSHELHPDYIIHHSQPHNLSVTAVPMQAHESHPFQRKEEEDSLGYHHGRITTSPPMAHMNNITSHNSTPTVAVVAHQPDISRYANPSTCCTCTCSERPRSVVGEKLGRLVVETFENLYPEYQEMAKLEIQQVLGKYLQKPVP